MDRSVDRRAVRLNLGNRRKAWRDESQCARPLHPVGHSGLHPRRTGLDFLLRPSARADAGARGTAAAVDGQRRVLRPLHGRIAAACLACRACQAWLWPAALFRGAGCRSGLRALFPLVDLLLCAGDQPGCVVAARKHGSECRGSATAEHVHTADHPQCFYRRFRPRSAGHRDSRSGGKLSADAPAACFRSAPQPGPVAVGHSAVQRCGHQPAVRHAAERAVKREAQWSPVVVGGEQHLRCGLHQGPAGSLPAVQPGSGGHGWEAGTRRAGAR